MDPEFGDAHFKEQDIMRWSLTHSFIHSFSRRVKFLTYIEHYLCNTAVTKKQSFALKELRIY